MRKQQAFPEDAAAGRIETDDLAPVDVHLTPTDLTHINATLPPTAPAGPRYPAQATQTIDP